MGPFVRNLVRWQHCARTRSAPHQPTPTPTPADNSFGTGVFHPSTAPSKATGSHQAVAERRPGTGLTFMGRKAHHGPISLGACGRHSPHEGDCCARCSHCTAVHAHNGLRGPVQRPHCGLGAFGRFALPPGCGRLAEGAAVKTDIRDTAGEQSWALERIPMPQHGSSGTCLGHRPATLPDLHPHLPF